MSSEKKLAVNVIVEGTTYLAGTVPPADVAEQITNPKAWGEPVPPVTIRTGVGPSELDKALAGDGKGSSKKSDDDKGSSGSGSGDGGVEDLKGAALDEALEAAGLAKSGSVAEKRARLAEHQAGSGS